MVVGLLIAIAFNVDTISIVGKLEKDPKLRDAIVQQADAFIKSHPNPYQERVNDLNNNKNYAIIYTKKDSSTIRYSRLDSIEYKNKLDFIARAKSDTLLNKLSMFNKKADSLLDGDIAKMNGLMGIGWSKTFKDHKYKIPNDWNWEKGTRTSIFEWFVVIAKWLITIIGWLITALALSLGAPFWFDLLNKMMQLRGSIGTSGK